MFNNSWSWVADTWSTGMISQFIFCTLKASIILKIPRRNVKPFWKLRLQKTQKNTHEYQLTQQLSPLCDVFVAKVDHEHTKVCHPQNYYHLIMKTQNCWFQRHKWHRGKNNKWRHSILIITTQSLFAGEMILKDFPSII